MAVAGGGVHPLDVVAPGSRQRLRRVGLYLFDLVLVAPGDFPFGASATEEHPALVPNQQRAVTLPPFADHVDPASGLEGRRVLHPVLFAVVPYKLHRRTAAAVAELIIDHRPVWGTLAGVATVPGAHAGWGTQFQTPPGHVHDVTGHVAERPGAKVPPAAPRKRNVTFAVRAVRRRAKPQIPVQAFGHVGLGRTRLHALRPDWAVGPDVRLGDVANDPGANQLDRTADRLAGVRLVAHLGGHASFPGQARQVTGLVHVVSQRLLCIAMLAHLHRHRGGRGVGVVGRGDSAGVDALAHLFEHHTKVGEALGLGVGLEHRIGAGLVHVTQRDYVCPGLGGPGDVRPALAAGADAGDGESAVCAEHTAWHDLKAKGGYCARADESPACHVCFILLGFHCVNHFHFSRHMSTVI